MIVAEYIKTLQSYEEYACLLTAANFHGAAHQKIQQDFIVTSPPTLRDVENGNIKKFNKILSSLLHLL